MAFPTIKIDVNDGAASDSACSGAGPATAVTGTCHNNNGVDGAVLTVSGSLTGVVDTGEHAIYVETSSGRRFARITGITGSQVTTANAFPAIDSGTPANYAIGGVRASLAGTNSRLLMEQAASAPGDASPGWTIELQDGHTETISSTVNVRVDFTSADGALTIKGADGASVRPVLTFNNTGDGFSLLLGSPRFENLEIKNSNETKTSSVAIRNSTTMSFWKPFWLKNVKIADSTDYFYNAIASTTNSHVTVIDSEIGHCGDTGILFDGGINFSTIRLIGSYVHDCGNHGIYCDQPNAITTTLWLNSVFANNTGSGARLFGNAVEDFSYGYGVKCVNCVFDNNGEAGVYIVSSRAQNYNHFANSQFTNNGTHGIRFSSSATPNFLMHSDVLLLGCNFYGNTTAATSVSDLLTSSIAIGCTTLDPQYVNAASGDYRTGNATLITGGYPSGNVAGTSSPVTATVGLDQGPSGSAFSPTFRRRSSPQLRM